MAIQLVVNGNTYLYPENRNSPSWGEDASAWAEAVTNVLADIAGANDITQTSATIANNQSSATNVSGLSFDTTEVRGAIVEYSVYRVTTGSGATEAVETGLMFLSYLSTAGTWDIATQHGGGAGVTFTVTNAGQVRYTSTNFTGSSYSGLIKFRARSLLQ